MKATIPIILILGFLLILPVSAVNITITAEPLGGTLNTLPSHQTSYTVDVSKLQRNAIQRIAVDVPTGTTVDYQIWYGNGSSLSGHMVYHSVTDTGACGQTLFVNNPCQFSEVSIGSSVSNHNYVGLEEIGRIDIVGYGRNADTLERVFVIYDSAFGLAIVGNLEWALSPYAAGDALAYVPVPQGSIYKFSLASDRPLTGVAYYTNTQTNVEKASNTSLLDVVTEWANLLIQIKDLVFEAFWFFYYLFEFIWDNLWLIIAMWLTMTGAVAFNKTKDVAKATQSWLGYQRMLLDFILNLIDRVVGLITKILK
jgi:hypothetical protein